MRRTVAVDRVSKVALERPQRRFPRAVVVVAIRGDTIGGLDRARRESIQESKVAAHRHVVLNDVVRVGQEKDRRGALMLRAYA